MLNRLNGVWNTLYGLKLKLSNAVPGRKAVPSFVTWRRPAWVVTQAGRPGTVGRSALGVASLQICGSSGSTGLAIRLPPVGFTLEKREGLDVPEPSARPLKLLYDVREKSRSSCSTWSAS